jgi:uncharacterized membrane protein
MPTLSPSDLALVGATFLASAVEIVETFTILLAMGLTRGWKSTVAGALVALVVLIVVTVVAGYTILRLIPESLLQLVIGTLLLIFGMQWLRKAILRSSGRKALHDEDAIFARETAASQAAGERRGLFGLDGFAFVVSFKGVLLEGLEVVVIVLTFGISAGNIPLAVAGALLAVIPVTLLVIVIRGPLSRVPENTIKFFVGLLLTTFGTFWAVEGLGIFASGAESLAWPLDDLFLAVILVAWVVIARLLVTLLRPRPVTVGEAA